MQISVNLQSGRFEEKSPNGGGEFLHADFSKSAEWQISEKISKTGWGEFCMQISVNLQSGRLQKKSPKCGGGGNSACRFQ